MSIFRSLPVRRLGVVVGAWLTLAGTLTHAADLRVEVEVTRSPESMTAAADQAVSRFLANAATLTEPSRVRQGLTEPFSLPVRVVLTQNGVPIAPPAPTRGRAGDLTLSFDTDGPGAFPAETRARLEATFAAAKPVMDAIFGTPAVGGAVRVVNADLDIPDRLAVTGGYYLVNGPLGPEIRFPIYNNPLGASINFVHTLLLAYRGPNAYFADAIQEGLVRAATMRVARTPGAIPIPSGFTEADIETVLAGLYDVGARYDWMNQPGLGSRKFIPDNLINTALPPGGSVGGPYLLRYQMAGTAWQKALLENPGFIAEFNRRFDLNPAAYTAEPALRTLGQEALDAVTGVVNSTVEGVAFGDWFDRQFILDTDTNSGTRLLVEPIPLGPAAQDDFGVFSIALHALTTQANGNEVLLNGRSFPLFWRPDFTRFFTSAQDDVLDLAGGYGSVTPNFPSATFNGQPYRVTVDLPFEGQVARVHLPAGGFATGANPAANTFYGVLAGLGENTGETYTVTVNWGGGQVEIPVTNQAFGARILDSTYLASARLTVTVTRATPGPATVLFERRVNKGPGGIAVLLEPPSAFTSRVLAGTARLFGIGLPIEPFRPSATQRLGLAPGVTLLARWDPTRGRYRFFPDESALLSGLGFFVRPPAAVSVLARGKAQPRIPVTVALEAGWNLITPPIQETLSVTQLRVTSSTLPVSTWSEGVGTLVGSTVFRFVPDPLDPDLGSLVEASSLEPGQVYFVRALRAEGAVLVFIPSDAGVQRSAQVAFSAKKPTPNLPTWETRLDLTRVGGHTVSARVGVSRSASDRFDPKFDSGLPTGPGGLQLYSLSGEKLYRDLRGSTRSSWTLRLEGLVPGQRYILRLRSLVGRSNLRLYDTSTGNWITPGATRWAFQATSPTLDLLVLPGGLK